VTYAFGVDGGVNWRIRRSAGGVFVNQGSAVAFTGLEAVLRIRRSGDELVFERRVDDSWLVVGRQGLPAGSTLVRGGLFVSTSAAENVRFAFDYGLVVNPGASNRQLSHLRITEMMYAPKAPEVAEWIEVQNTGLEEVSLSGVRFPQGLPFDELVLPEVVVAAGQRVVLTSSTAAFRARYGPEPRVVAEWAGGALNNAGEAVVLFDSDGNTIHDFAYGVVEPWPLAARGGGASLEVIDTEGDYSSALNWRASEVAGGTPGADGAIGPDPDADSDGDGVTDVAEGWFGTDPADANAVARLTVLGVGQFSFPSVAGNRYELQVSDTLTAGGWTTLSTVTAEGPVTLISDPTEALFPVRFYRVEALRP